MLTGSQLITLKADIQTNFAGVPMNADGHFLIAQAYNVDASPAFVVWRTAVPIEEMMANGFQWNEVDALTAGQARIWQWMSQLGVINPSKATVRQGLNNAFSANAPVTLGNTSAGTGGVQPHLRRNAKRGERVFATGTGTAASPG